jgi:hypothetical protein
VPLAREWYPLDDKSCSIPMFFQLPLMLVLLVSSGTEINKLIKATL